MNEESADNKLKDEKNIAQSIGNSRNNGNDANNVNRYENTNLTVEMAQSDDNVSLQPPMQNKKTLSNNQGYVSIGV